MQWTGSDGSSKRWGPFAENDTTFLFVHEYLIGSDTNRYKVFIRKGPQPNDIPNFASLSPQNESAWKDFTDLLHTLKKRRPGPLAHHAALAGLPHSWTPVRSFRGSYYVNCFNPYPVWISDSLFVRQTMDGPRPSRISAAERIAPTHYRLRTTASTGWTYTSWTPCAGWLCSPSAMTGKQNGFSRFMFPLKRDLRWI